ncbi:MAG: formylglycine-generating enzyme family protein [Alloprevotella sp.]|nr:formylglycine-generating enzyme family protein [Alloprevotella sp.]MDY6297357.1 formylglycine-generating enzyme family protein [Alloprevotella sp.]
MLRVKFAVLVLPLALSMASCGKTDKSTEAIDSLMAHMVSVEGGTFTMGATEEQKTDVAKDERPLHEVTLSDFKIGRYEVTQAQWVAVMGQNPSKEQGDDLPVTNVSWDDCQQFLKRLNEMTGHAFRLPTEAEWEYAARGGKLARPTQYAGEADNPRECGWYVANSGYKVHAVGGKKANELGLYDMSGNVWEWCDDWYVEYTDTARTNPRYTQQVGGEGRVDRGGAWDSQAASLRTSYRDSGQPGTRVANVGFRIAE